MDEQTAPTPPRAGERRFLPLSVPTYFPRRQASSVQSILLVEDDLALANLEAETLAAHGYTVMTVPSGELALSLLNQRMPDLVVLDLELPGTISGWDVLHHLRTVVSVPILITSSSPAVFRKQLPSETRFTLDHLAKPYPLQQLLKRVKRMLPFPSNSERF